MNATFLLLHRFLFRWLNGRPVFLTVNRVPVNYGHSTRRLNTDSEVVIKILVRRERISSYGRSSYSTNVANLAELRRLIGFTNQIQQRTVSIQSDLLELLDPALLDAMHGISMLLPHSVHQYPRPFWVLSNIAAETDTVQIIDLLHRYDMELRAAAIAQGNDPPPQILTMINIIAIIPANLLPLPHQASRNHAVRRPVPSPTYYFRAPEPSC